MCSDNNRFVYEVCDIFGDNLTITEVEYWMAYGPIKTANMLGVNIDGASFDEAVALIESEITRRKRRWEKK